MRSLLAAVALVLLVAPPACSGGGPEPNSEPDPPLAYRHVFPPHAWCVEQAEAAELFRYKCERALMVYGPSDPQAEKRWLPLLFECKRRLTMWRRLQRIQEPVPSLPERERQQLLGLLYRELGPDAFFAGRMPPPIPEGAPID